MDRPKQVRRRKAPPLKLPPSEDDIWLARLHTECARAAAQWLKGSVNLERQIKTLTLPELKGLAAAVESKWICLVAARLVAPTVPFTTEEASAYAALIMG